MFPTLQKKVEIPSERLVDTVKDVSGAMHTQMRTTQKAQKTVEVPRI